MENSYKYLVDKTINFKLLNDNFENETVRI